MDNQRSDLNFDLNNFNLTLISRLLYTVVVLVRVLQSAERSDLKSEKCGFKSHHGHQKAPCGAFSFDLNNFI